VNCRGEQVIAGRNGRSSMIFAVMLLLSITGCAAGLTREMLLEKMSSGDALLIIDVRSQAEYDRGHLPGAVHLSFYAVGSGLGELGVAKNEPLVLYCEHGPRSGIASLTLFVSGYEQVYSLDGHMRGWRNNEFPIEVVVQ
jgi:rhodanese-related sulfurtransferase